MSLSLAKTWVNATVGQSAARADSLRLLNDAAAEGLEATLIVGPRLTTNGKCFLGRWDGRELVVRELSAAQQQDWSIDPKGLFRQLEPVAVPHATFSTERLISLAVSHVEEAEGHDGWTPLSGVCVADHTSLHGVIRNCALRAEYFRPDLQRQVTQMWYADRELPFGQTMIHFHFPPLFSSKNLHTCRGTLVVYFQFFTAEDWTGLVGCRRISNVADAVITLR